MNERLEEPSAKTRQLLDSISTPVFVLGEKEKGQAAYIFINKIVRDEASYCREDYFGKNSSELFSTEGSRFSTLKHNECLRTGKEMSYELTVCIAGNERHIRTTLRPLVNEKGQVWRIIGTSIRVDAEHLIAETQIKSMAENAEIEHIINMSAHDLRSPMRNMQVLTEILLDDHEGESEGCEARHIIQALHKVSHNTISLIGNIIDYAQSTSATELAEAFEIKELCSKLQSILDPDNRYTLHVDDVLVIGDRIATQIILRNLIGNAFKYNQGADIEITVSVSSVRSGFYLILVRDNGKGVRDPQKRFSANNGSSKIGGGFGSQGILRLLKERNGEISAHHIDDGPGLEVRFSLPGSVVEEKDR